MKQTLTKAELFALLANVADDELIYFHARTSEANRAIAVAKLGGGDELFFRLSGEAVPESNGISIVADFKWAD
jgi:hypothetical protein